jgi:hypothetical protein
VYVCNYVTEGSFDGFIWQTLETKSRFIGQMRSGDVTIRAIDDISEVVLSAAEIKAIASGNPKVIRKVQLDAELTKLASLQSSHRDTQVRMRRKLGDIAYGRERMRERRAMLIAAQAVAEKHQDKDFKAAVVKGALTNEAVAYTKREAAGQALRQVAAELLAQAELSNQKVARTIGAYHGFMVCVQAHPHAAAPDVFLALEQDGTVTPIFAYPIKCETDIGVFASADSQIRGIPESIQRLDAELTRMDQEEAQITAAFDLPWDQAERYAQLSAELEALNAELNRKDDSAAATESAAETASGGIVTTPAASRELHIVEVSDADVLERTVAQPVAPTLLMPPVALPEPSDWAVMEAAMAQLATMGAVVEVEEDEVEAVVEIETAAEATDVLDLPPVALGVSQPTAVELAIGREDVILPKRTSRSTLVFGNTEHIKRTKQKQQTRQAKHISAAKTADMFAAEPAAPLQMCLF